MWFPQWRRSSVSVLGVDSPLLCTNLEAACASLAVFVTHFSTAAPKHEKAGLGAGRRTGRWRREEGDEEDREEE